MMKAWQELYSGLEDMSIKGGSNIGVVAAQALCAFVKEKIHTDAGYIEDAIAFGEKIKKLKPSMGSVQNVVDDLTAIVEANSNDAATTLQTLDQYLARYQQETEQALERVAELTADLIEEGETLFTHSYSRSVLMALEKAASVGKNFSVISAESRPRNEGAYLATLLASQNIQVTVVTDAATAHYMPRVDRVLVGADALYSDGTVVNKMGTLSVAIIAREFHKPLYVLAITSKLYLSSMYGKRLCMERRPESEVMALTLDEQFHPNLKAENLFFEEVSPEYITSVVTEKGLLKPCQILEAIKLGKER